MSLFVPLCRPPGAGLLWYKVYGAMNSGGSIPHYLSGLLRLAGPHDFAGSHTCGSACIGMLSWCRAGLLGYKEAWCFRAGFGSFTFG